VLLEGIIVERSTSGIAVAQTACVTTTPQRTKGDAMAPGRGHSGGQHCGAEVVTSGQLNGSNFIGVAMRAQSRGDWGGGAETVPIGGARPSVIGTEK
jgi:hypothetical protein